MEKMKGRRKRGEEEEVVEEVVVEVPWWRWRGLHCRHPPLPLFWKPKMTFS